MMQDKPIIIDADTARKMRLNRERNRPKYDPTKPINSGEATQEINPLTGRVYGDKFVVAEEIRGLYDKISSIEGLIKNKWDLLSKYGGHFSPETNQTIELQKALGRMEVREGITSLQKYMAFVYSVRRLVKLYQRTCGLTLDSITDVNGLNSALDSMECSTILKNSFVDYFSMDLKLDKRNIIDFIPLKERIPSLYYIIKQNN